MKISRRARKIVAGVVAAAAVTLSIPATFAAMGPGPGKVVRPLKGYHITAKFGQCGSNWSHCHTGLDFAAPTGTPVRAVAGGTIISAGWAGAYGNRIIVRHRHGTTVWYCHLSKMVRKGGTVKAGTMIGRVGTTGNVTGPHLHLEVHPKGGRAVAPGPWLRKYGAPV